MDVFIFIFFNKMVIVVFFFLSFYSVSFLFSWDVGLNIIYFKYVYIFFIRLLGINTILGGEDEFR